MIAAPETEIELVNEAEHEHPALTPDLFRMFMDVLALIKNEREFKRRLNGLHTAMTTLAADRKKDAAVRATFEEYKATTIAELEQRKKTADRVWEHVLAGKAAHEQSEARCKQLEARCEELEKENERLRNPVAPDPDYDFVPPAGASITQSPARHLSRSSPQGDTFSSGTSVTRSVEDAASI
jgi:hypothetical protein